MRHASPIPVPLIWSLTDLGVHKGNVSNFLCICPDCWLAERMSSPVVDNEEVICYQLELGI